MNTVSKPKSEDLSIPESGPRQIGTPKRLEIVPDFKHLSPELKAEAKVALLEARNKVLQKAREAANRVLANEKGQLSLFQDDPREFKDVTEVEDEKIPADIADEIMEKALVKLGSEKGIAFEIRDGAVRIIRADEKVNPRAEIGY